MGWIYDFLKSSIGKKQVMALTGAGFIAFLFLHLAGNLTIYGGNAYFNGYVHNLHRLGPLILVFEWGLVFFAVVHVSTAALLYYANWGARGQSYVMKKGAGGSTWSSRTMPYTGLVILAFVIVHLLNFRFAGGDNRPMAEIVRGCLTRPGYLVFYLAAVMVLGFHVRHAFWSAAQSFGLNHPRYMPVISALSIIVGFIVALGFASIPVFINLSA